jgi:outer membrane immunogenic protein
MKISLRSLLLAGVSSIAIAGTASAADLAVKAPPPLIPISTWAGFYIGIHGGAARLNATQHHFNEDGICFEASTCTFNATGGVGGVQVGYNWQSRYFVYGVEADWSWTGLKNSQDVNALGVPGTVKSQVNWLGSVRGRMGLALEDTLVYVTGGVAFGGTKSGWGGGYAGTNPACCDVQSGTRVGWVVGAGVEHMLTQNVTFRAEGLYYDLGREQKSFFAPGNATPYRTEFSHEVFVGRVGLNFKW